MKLSRGTIVFWLISMIPYPFRKFANEYKFYIHCHFFVKASSDETPEWFKRKAEELVKEQISDLIISV